MSGRKFVTEGQPVQVLLTDELLIIRDGKEAGVLSLGDLIKFISENSEIVGSVGMSDYIDGELRPKQE